jgi:hypothetical protein
VLDHDTRDIRGYERQYLPNQHSWLNDGRRYGDPRLVPAQRMAPIPAPLARQREILAYHEDPSSDDSSDEIRHLQALLEAKKREKKERKRAVEQGNWSARFESRPRAESSVYERDEPWVSSPQGATGRWLIRSARSNNFIREMM